MSSAKVTQRFKLYELLSTGEPVEVQVIAETLGIERTSVPVYINAMKKLYKAEIESVFVEHPTGNGNRKVRRVTHYKLVNAIKVPKHRTNTSHVEATEPDDGSVVPTIDPDNDLTKISDAEMSDITDSLGIDSDRGGLE